ncbi:response regulator transcription factor [Chloroflexi bacterium TSY]|nr:response regulator transcription factor [Chloroflexi bacterium TSY]
MGVQGLLLRTTDGNAMTTALSAITQGLLVLDPALSAFLRTPQITPEGSDSSGLVDPLTPRELEVLQLVAEGLPNKTIARHLNISEHTVKFHLNAILGKFNASSRTEAVVRATRAGLILI